jgi:hypothetical protein
MPIDLMIQITVNHKETEELACALSAAIAVIS